MNKKVKITTIIAEIAIVAAIGFVLDELGSGIFKGIFPAGGSITIAMSAVFILGYRRGFLPALFAGLIIGGLDAITGAYVVGTNAATMIFSLCLDYLFPYAFAALGTLFAIPFKKSTDKKQKITFLLLGVIFGGLFKLTSHYLSGVIFYANPDNFEWGLNSLSPFIYSLLYNGGYIIPSIVLNAIVMLLIYLKAPQILLEKKIEEEKELTSFSIEWKILPILLLAFGLVGFIPSLINFIKSFATYSDDWDGIHYGIDANGDYLILSFSFLMVTGFAIFFFIKALTNHPVKAKTISLMMCFPALVVFIHSLAAMIKIIVKNIVKGKSNPYIQYLWYIIPSLLIFVFFLIVAIILFKMDKKIEKENEQKSI